MSLPWPHTASAQGKCPKESPTLQKSEQVLLPGQAHPGNTGYETLLRNTETRNAHWVTLGEHGLVILQTGLECWMPADPVLLALSSCVATLRSSLVSGYVAHGEERGT